MTEETRGTTVPHFTLAQILTITADMLLCSMGEVYEILNYMTGDNLFTHQLPRAGEECKPEILRQHPQLANVDASSVTPETWRDWLNARVEEFGPSLPLLPLPMGAHLSIDPVTELAAMVGDKKVIVLKAGEGNT